MLALRIKNAIALWLFSVSTALFPPTTPSSANEVAEIANSIRKSQEKVLQLQGGIQFKYEITAEQQKASPYFLYAEGLTGHFQAKWPRIHNKINGIRYGIVILDEKTGKPVKVKQADEREGSYDFHTRTSIVREGHELGQIVGERHAPTAEAVFPLAAQYMVFFSRLYSPSRDLQTKYWLPNALEQKDYIVAGRETVAGISCVVLKRPEVDVIWIADEHGYVVCKRELKWSKDKNLRERMECSELTEVAPGCWLPQKIIQDTYDRDAPGKRLYQLTIRVSDIEVGHVSDDLLTVEFPKGIQRVEDYVTGVTSTKPPGANEQESLEMAISSVLHIGGSNIQSDVTTTTWRATFMLCNIVVILGLVAAIMYVRQS
jgi:hypothetical protein